jgi:nitroreductase
VLPASAWAAFSAGHPGFLVALTSVVWREAWKYGERAFRYCQHDVGHALGALRLSAARLGWRMTLLPRWADSELAAVFGLDRDADYGDGEREEPECVAVVTPGEPNTWLDADPAILVDAARAAAWRGTANRLSSGHLEWPILEQVARATRYSGTGDAGLGARGRRQDRESVQPETPRAESHGGGFDSRDASPECPVPARDIILRRRSAVAFDARSALPRDTFLSMLRRLDAAAPPFDALHWPPHVHLALFVHRVDGLLPGIYAYMRDHAAQADWRAAMRPDFLWDHVAPDPGAPRDPRGLFLLAPIDVTWPANRLSCDQEIAGDGFFSLGMLARFEQPLRDRGDWFYRRLFWECGMIGQVLYLEAEAAGARATGIGCFYDDQVHALLGLSGHSWQSLYHFSMGVAVDDPRLSTAPGYEWERDDQS